MESWEASHDIQGLLVVERRLGAAKCHKPACARSGRALTLLEMSTAQEQPSDCPNISCPSAKGAVLLLLYGRAN